MRVELGAPGPAQRLLDTLGEQCDVVVADRPPLAGLADTDDDLLPAEPFDEPGAFDHRQACRLEGREAPVALGTLPTTADGGAVVRRPRVHHS